jgi:hypothetical protein
VKKESWRLNAVLGKIKCDIGRNEKSMAIINYINL